MKSNLYLSDSTVTSAVSPEEISEVEKLQRYFSELNINLAYLRAQRVLA